MLLTVRDNFATYRIECPADAQVKLDWLGSDVLIVADPNGAEPYWLFDSILLEAARAEEFGLRLVSCLPHN
jgi:hypothetical protein